MDYSRHDRSYAFPNIVYQFNNGRGLSRRNNRRAFQLARDDTRGMRGRPFSGESASERGKKVARNPDSRRYFREGRRTPCSDLAPHRHTLLQQFSNYHLRDRYFFRYKSVHDEIFSSLVEILARTMIYTRTTNIHVIMLVFFSYIPNDLNICSRVFVFIYTKIIEKAQLDLHLPIFYL